MQSTCAKIRFQSKQPQSDLKPYVLQPFDGMWQVLVSHNGSSRPGQYMATIRHLEMCWPIEDSPIQTLSLVSDSEFQCNFADAPYTANLSEDGKLTWNDGDAALAVISAHGFDRCVELKFSYFQSGTNVSKTRQHVFHCF